MKEKILELQDAFKTTDDLEWYKKEKEVRNVLGELSETMDSVVCQWYSKIADPYDKRLYRLWVN